MIEPETREQIDRLFCLTGICDGCVCAPGREPHCQGDVKGDDLFDGLEFHQCFTDPTVTHLVMLTGPNVARIAQKITRFLAEMGSTHAVRLLVRPEHLDTVPRHWPVVGTAVDDRDTVSRLVGGTWPSRGGIIYISPYALSEDNLQQLRGMIETRADTTFVLSGMGGTFWRFAMLLACQFENVFLDTAGITSRRFRSMLTSRYQLARILNGLCGKLIFASGYPGAYPQDLLQLFVPWFTTDRACKAVLRGNALRIYFKQPTQ